MIFYSVELRDLIFLGLTTLGAKVTLARTIDISSKEFSQMGAYVTHNLEEALLDADTDDAPKVFNMKGKVLSTSLHY